MVLQFWTPCEHQPWCSAPRASPVVLHPPVPRTRAWTVVLPGSHPFVLSASHRCTNTVTSSADVPLRSRMDHGTPLIPDLPAGWGWRSGKGLRKPCANGLRLHRQDEAMVGSALRRALRRSFLRVCGACAAEGHVLVPDVAIVGPRVRFLAGAPGWLGLGLWKGPQKSLRQRPPPPPPRRGDGRPDAAQGTPPIVHRTSVPTTHAASSAGSDSELSSPGRVLVV